MLPSNFDSLTPTQRLIMEQAYVRKKLVSVHFYSKTDTNCATGILPVAPQRQMNSEASAPGNVAGERE